VQLRVWAGAVSRAVVGIPTFLSPTVVETSMGPGTEQLLGEQYAIDIEMRIGSCVILPRRAGSGRLDQYRKPTLIVNNCVLIVFVGA